jgi:hypothetical protein
MSTTTLTRLSGLALIAAFALTLTGGILHPVIGGDSHAAPSLAQPLFSTAHLLIFLGEICLLFGLPGLYARIAPRTGLLGLFGFVLYFFANATLASFVSAYEAFIVPVLALDPATSTLVAPDGAIPSSAPFTVLQGIGGLVYMLGLVVLGIAVFRSRVMPRWTGVLMAASPIFLLLPIPEAPVLSGLLIELPRGLAVAGMGYTLFVRGEEEPTNTRDAELA